MDTLKIAICDDEVLLLPYLTAHIKQTFSAIGLSCTVSTYSTGRDLLAGIYGNAAFDVIFLDIDIPETDGIQLAERLREIRTSALIVFVSAKEELVFQSLKTHPYAFVRKSNFLEDIGQTIRDIGRLRAKPDALVVDIQDGLGHLHKVNIQQTMYFEAKDKYCKHITVAADVLLRCTMQAVEDALAVHHFLRVHKTYLVNARFIYKVGNDHVRLDNGKKIPLSRHRQKRVKQLYCAFQDQ